MPKPASLDYNEELDRRAAQFAEWLGRMRLRRQRTGEDDCFITFDEDERQKTRPVTKVSRTRSLVCSGVSSQNNTGVSSPHGDDSPEDGAGQDEPFFARFVQFCFEAQFFWMELPNTTLSRREGEQLMRDRNGFLWLKDSTVYVERLCARFDPMAKFYLYGDEMRAGEDMAHIFFQLWKFPVDWRFFVNAACFEGPDFESDLPIE